MEHLCSYYDRLLGLYAFVYDFTLNAGNTLYRNLYAKVTTGYHDAIRCLYYLVDIVNTLLILNLGYDSDV